MSENSSVTLPPLSDETIERIERALFDEIGSGRPQSPAARPAAAVHPRRRRWAVGLGVAAAFVGGILVAPPLVSVVAGPSVMPAVELSGADSAGGSIARDGAAAPPMSAGEMADADAGVVAGSPEAAASDRDIITTARMTLRVVDVPKAAAALTALAEEHGGYVESASLGQGADVPVDDLTPAPAPPEGSGWISLRIPAADLSEVMKAIDGEGQVLRSSISRQDVTTTAVDLRARVDASRASVERLTELMSRSGSVKDLIAAESALSERQSQLESYQQQLKSLDEQVSLSTVHVELTKRAAATQADPAGFGDGLLAGWNGLVVTLNALVVAIGFLLPWLVIAGVVLLVVLLVRRRARRTRVP